jgi:hypothetical protein
MQSLQIKTGEIRLQILDDAGEERGIFKFNPTDLESAKKVIALQSELAAKQAEFEKRVANCETPEDKVNCMAEVCDYFEGIIDDCFGAGSSKLLFGDAKTLSMFDDFLTGIMPYYEQASKERVAKYSPKKTSKS